MKTETKWGIGIGAAIVATVGWALWPKKATAAVVPVNPTGAGVFYIAGLYDPTNSQPAGAVDPSVGDLPGMNAQEFGAAAQQAGLALGPTLGPFKDQTTAQAQMAATLKNPPAGFAVPGAALDALLAFDGSQTGPIFAAMNTAGVYFS